MLFKNRYNAGTKLAEVLGSQDIDFANTVILGLARGGVAIAAKLAELLQSRAMAFCIEDLRVSQDEVLIMTSMNLSCIINRKTGEVKTLDDLSSFEDKGISSMMAEISKRDQLYHPEGLLKPGDSVILCDDGLVSGETMIAALLVLKEYGIEVKAIAVPVIPAWAAEFDFGAPLITCRASTMKHFTTGGFYIEFEQMTDDQVVKLLRSQVSAVV